MDEQNALVPKLQQEVDYLKKQVESLKSERQDIAVLGDGEVFLRMTPEGAIKAVTGVVTLTEKAGDIYEIPGYNERPSKFPITASGYNRMNQIANVSIITPKTLTLPNGVTVPNPYAILGERSKAIENVWVKKMAIGYSPTGNLVVTTSTLFFNTKLYFIQDCIKKIKNNAKAGKYYAADYIDYLKEKKPDEYYKLVSPPGMLLQANEFTYLWVDTTEKEILTCLETYNQTQLFAERKAQTIAERNCMKKHPALSTVYVDAKGGKGNTVAKVKVIGWITDLSKEDLERIAEQVERGEKPVVNGKEVLVMNDDIDEVTEEDYKAATDEEEVIPEDKVIDVTPEEEKEPEHPASKEKEKEEKEKVKNVMAQIMQGISILGDEKARGIIQKNFRTTIDKLKPKQLEQALKIISLEIDKEAAY